MKKIKLFFLGLFISSTTFAQYYGVDGGVIAAGRIAIHLIEAKKYKEIEKWQDYIFAANGIVAMEMTKLNDLEKKMYKGYSKLDETIKSAQLILLIIDESEQTYEIIKNIKELGDDNLKVQAYTLDLQAFLIAEVVFIMNDYLVATKEGKKNLLNSADRYFLLDFFYKRIIKLKEQAQTLFVETNAMSKVSLYDFSNDNELTIDFTPLSQSMIDAYNEIFPITLKED